MTVFRRAAAVVFAAAALTALAVPAASASVTPRPLPPSAYNPDARRVACNTFCYHIQEKNGSQFMAGFNSDDPGYFLKSKDTPAARDIILVSIPDTCNLGSSCFEARMVTVQNLEVVTSTCTVNAGQTFELESGSGHTGDVYKFYVSGGDNFIRSRSCDNDVAFQNKLDANMEFGQGLYYKVLYFAGT